jgi:hypothetical protein
MYSYSFSLRDGELRLREAAIQQSLNVVSVAPASLYSRVSYKLEASI